MRLSFKTVPLAALSLALTACGGSSSGGSDDSFTYDATSLISNLTDNIIVAGYEDLDSKAGDLINALSVLQTNQNETSLQTAQNAWKAARQPWEQGEAHIFGPVDSLEIDPHLDSWPLNTNDMATLVNEANPDFSSLNDDIQGFHAMEYLLFGNGATTNTRAADLNTNELAYLAALSQAFEGYTDDLYQAWQTSFENSSAYKSYLLTPGNAYYASDLAVMDELINGMIGIVDEVANGKIADPFGSSAGEANTSLVESQYSWNSLTDFANNIRGVQNVYQGEFSGNSDQPGIVDFVAAADSELATRIEGEISASIAAIENIGNDGSSETMPFRVAIADASGRVRIQAAIDALHTLLESLNNDVLPLLDRWENTAD